MAKITTGELYNEWQLINDKLLTQIDRQDEIITKQQAIIDRFDEPIDTRLTGSNVEEGIPVKIGLNYELETIVNAATVDAGGTLGDYFIPRKDATEFYILINTDKAPWSLSDTSTSFGTGARRSDEKMFYPEVDNITSTRRYLQIPYLVVPIDEVFLTAIREPSTLSEVHEASGLKNVASLRFENKSLEVATVSIRALRIWR